MTKLFIKNQPIIDKIKYQKNYLINNKFRLVSKQPESHPPVGLYEIDNH